MSGAASDIDGLEAAIAALQAQRALLGDAVVELALAPLRRQLSELRGSPAPTARGRVLEGERRTVTIMFADISGFTAMAEKMDPEQVRSLMNACFDALVPAITRYGGTVDKFIGDEIMALFGAPQAHEDDPQRALRAALEMMHRLQVFNAGRGTDLGLHFGINTGPVIAGGIGDKGHQQYSVMGDAVNLAARLQDVSERGEIFIGPDTWRRVSALFEFEALPPLRLKGKSEPVIVYKLLGERRQPLATRGLPGMTASLLEREAELDRLRQVHTVLKSGTGGAVVVIAEAGLGKSRLLADSGPDPSLLLLQAACVSHTQDQPYFLVSGLLRALLGLPDSAPAPRAYAALRDLAIEHLGEGAIEVWPALAHLMLLHSELRCDAPAHHRVAGVDVPSLPGLYGAALRRLLMACAARRPLLLVVEDLHWADPSSVELLTRLLAAGLSAPLCFVFISRPDLQSAGWPLVNAARTALTGRTAEMALQPLSKAAAEQMVTELLAEPQLPRSVHDLVRHKAEGNPLFIEEVVRMLIERGGLVREDSGRWAASPVLDSLQVPDKLEGLLLARIDRLPEALRHAMRVAAVIGRRFTARLLRELLGGQLPPMEALEASGLLQPGADADEPGWFFSQSLAHEAAYASLLQSDRRLLHREVADAIERLHAGRLEEMADTLGHHLERAEEWARALTWLRRAADSAWQRFALREAQVLYGRALACAERVPLATSDELAMRLKRLECMARTGAPPQQTLDVIERCLTLAGDDAARAQVHFHAGQALHIFMRSDLQAAERHYRQALDLLDRRGRPHPYGSVLAHLGYLHRYLGQPGQAVETLERALQLAQEQGGLAPSSSALALRAEVLVYLSGAYLDLERVDEARQAGERALRLATELGSVELQGRAHSFLADVCLAHGPGGQALHHLTEMRRFAREFGVAVLGAFGAMGMATLAEREGDRDAAISALEEAARVWRDAGLAHRAVWPWVERARLLLMAGEATAAEEALFAARRDGSAQAGWTELLVARALALGGRLDEACAAAEAGLAAAASAEQRAQWLRQLQASGLEAAPGFGQHLQRLSAPAAESPG